jgi:Zn-dependent protease
MVRATAVLFAALALGSTSASAAGDTGIYLGEQVALNPAGQPVITPDQARALVSALWIARATAFTYGLAPLTNTYEAQAAAEFDENADSAIYGDPGTIGGITIMLARQMTFPATFIAVVRTDAPGRKRRREGIVMSRPNAKAPWKLAIDTVFYAGADDLAPLVGDDGYALQPSGPLGMKEADPGDFYAAGLSDGSEVACYAVRSGRTTRNSWWHPLHVTRSEYLPPGYYTTTAGHRLWQACTLVPTYASGLESRLLGELDGTVALSGTTEPPPWLGIGLVGIALVAAAYALMAYLRPTTAASSGSSSSIPSPIPATPRFKTISALVGYLRARTAAWSRPRANSPPPTPATPRLKTITAIQQQTALLGLLVLAVEAGILVEIIRSLSEARRELGLAVLVLWLIWVMALLLPWLRRDGATASLLIPASPHAVWAALADRTVGLDPEMVFVERTSTGPVGVGSMYREVEQVPNGPQVEFASVLTAYEPGREIAVGYPQLWHRQAHRHVLTPDGEGTLVTSTHELTMSPLLAIMGGIIFKRQLRRRSERNRRQSLRQLYQRVTGAEAPAEERPARRGRAIPAGLWVGVVVMAVSGLLSLGGYTLVFGAALGALIMAILVIHELGHFAEARRNGLSVRLPFFIPFIGAAVTLRTMPGDAATHARIALAGPLIGTLAVAAAFLAAALTNSQAVIFFAEWGALINLANLIPMGMLDGGSILAPISRWISVFGLLLAILFGGWLTLVGQFSPFLLVFAGLTVFVVVNRFRQHRTPYYRSVRRRAQFVIGTIWFAAFCYLAFAGFAATAGLLLS